MEIGWLLIFGSCLVVELTLEGFTSNGDTQSSFIPSPFQVLACSSKAYLCYLPSFWCWSRWWRLHCQEIPDSSPWLLKTPDSSSWLLTPPDFSSWLLTPLTPAPGSWCPMTLATGSWQPWTPAPDSWQILTTHPGSWQPLTPAPGSCTWP